MQKNIYIKFVVFIVLVLNISYQSERSGYFEKTITVYCNTVLSPIMIRIRGKSK
ncbi:MULTISPECIES: DUF1573 domain-containing protein [Bacteroides]|uniref:DUF1573 domain-containing protein n=1 Tax=Bacteroides TaxID=816 RepID=UPI000C76B282|nr:DUF1573 domain-containing protein [Bacteroides sp. OM08-11]